MGLGTELSVLGDRRALYENNKFFDVFLLKYPPKNATNSLIYNMPIKVPGCSKGPDGLKIFASVLKIFLKNATDAITFQNLKRII